MLPSRLRVFCLTGERFLELSRSRVCSAWNMQAKSFVIVCKPELENDVAIISQFPQGSVKAREIHLSNTFCTEKIEKELKLRQDPNKFGTLSTNSSAEKLLDKDDIIEDEYVTYPVPSRQRLRISQYAKLIKEHVANKDIEGAVDVLEMRMIQEDRVKPDAYIYSLVISACGRFGLTRKAFQLYKKMRDRGLKIPGAVYTALFNACANSPDTNAGLQRLNHLKESLIEKSVELNSTHYHAMIKAYGRCGDLRGAFQIADFMIDKNMKISEQAFNFLLQACISSEHDGFRHALWVWHKMMQRRVKPTIYSFNLMLRAVRDCGLGEPSSIMDSLQQLTQEHFSQTPVQLESDDRLLSEKDLDNLPAVPTSSKKIPINSLMKLPDLLSPLPRLHCDVSDLDFSKPHERFFLLGGIEGFLQHMSKHDVTPDIKTYTLFLDCIPPTIAAEQKLMEKMKKAGVQLDTEFCNMLIKKRSFRFDYINAQKVLNIFQEIKLLPDIVTFGVLALSCTTEEQARELIKDMRCSGFRINEEILGAMLKQGCVRQDFKYVTKLLYIAKEENIAPSPRFLEILQNLVANCREHLKNTRNSNDPAVIDQRKHFRKQFTTFMYKYEAWLKEVNRDGRKSMASG